MATMATVDPLLTIRSRIHRPGLRWYLAGWTTRASPKRSARCGRRRVLPEIWWIIVGISLSLLMMLGACIGHLLMKGVGVWGNNNPAYWGWPIVNFVFWVGIGHAGTLISAILFLFRQNWRTSINRAAEAMTIFAVVCAGMFPGIHIGRVWVVLLAVSDSHRTPGDVAQFPQPAAVGRVCGFDLCDGFVVVLVHGHGSRHRHVPRSIEIEDRQNRLRYAVAGLDRFGRGWHRYEMAYTILAALATPLVLSVHTIVSFDFAVSQLPGWHTTIFPPYFVAGAIFSGFAMVVTLLVPVRKLFNLENLITIRHLENMNKIIMATGIDGGYGVRDRVLHRLVFGVPSERFAFYQPGLW